MAKLVTKRTTTTITEEVELVPAPAGEKIEHRFMVSGTTVMRMRILA